MLLFKKKKAAQVFQKLQQLEQFKNSKNISIYISMPTCEIMTTEIIQYLLESGTTKQPRIYLYTETFDR